MVRGHAISSGRVSSSELGAHAASPPHSSKRRGFRPRHVLCRTCRGSNAPGFPLGRGHIVRGCHDLTDLLRASGLLRVDDEYMRRRGQDDKDIQDWGRQLRAAVNDVVTLWHNNLRFASEKSLKAHLRRVDKLHGIKGDPLKKNSQDLINAAKMIVDRGAVLWALKNELKKR